MPVPDQEHARALDPWSLDVASVCPFRAARVVWRAPSGAPTLTVVCTGTFALVPGEARLAETQDPPNEEDRHWQDDPARSVRLPSDLAPMKRRADVVIIGHAFSPGAPCTSLTARLAIGAVDKAIAIESTSPFSKASLRYERAAGSRLIGAAALANAEPVGFGPIAATWRARQRALGPMGAAWRADMTSGAMPDDLDPAFFQVAPPDQQLDEIDPDAEVHLEGLHPEHARLTTRLPGLRPRVFVEARGAAGHEIAMRCDTLWIDADRGLARLTWRGQIDAVDASASGLVIIAMEKATPVLRVPRPSAPPPRPASVPPPPPPQPPRPARSERPPPIANEDRPQHLQTMTMTRVVPDPASGAPAWLARQRPSSPAMLAPTAAGLVDPLPSLAAIPTGPPGALSGALSIEDARSFASPSAMPSAPPIMPPVAPTFGPPPIVPARSPSSPPPAIPAPEPPAAPRLGGLRGAASALLTASNEAAGMTPKHPPSQPPSAPVAPVAPSSPPTRPRHVELLYFDPASVGAMRERFKEAFAPPAKKPGAEVSFRAPAPPPPSPEQRDRSAIAGLLGRTAPASPAALRSAINDAFADDGTFAAPLVVVGGELELTFDAIEVLRALIASASPIAHGNKKLKAAIQSIEEVVQTPGFEGASAGDAAVGMSARLREEVAQANRSLPAGYLDQCALRLVLERRKYQRRTVFGDTFIRALLHLPDKAAIPTYLPDAIGPVLPLFHRLDAIAVAEAHAAQDQYESHPTALKIIALGRALARPA